MAKKTFVNPFATVGFNQGNYTPYEQQNLLDAEENDRLYQEYLNSGMAQQDFQPQDNSSAIGRGLTAGAAGVIEGQAQLANLLGVGDGQMVQYLQKINRNNARKKEYSIADMIPFASDYWTNTEGAAYDVANMLGSSGAMMAETAALMTGAGAIGGALGLGGGAAAAAGGGFAGALSRGAGLAPNAVKKLAGKMAAAANNRGYTKLGKALEGPMGQMYALNILKTPVEVSSEAGSAGADALAEGADVWEARKRAGITALVQAPLLAMSNTIEAANLGGLFSKEIGKKATKEAIIGLLGDITKDGLQNAWEEGMQQSSQEYAAGKQSLLGVVNPFQWSPEALQEAAVGAVGGMALGGGNAMLGTVVGDRETQQTPNQELPTQQPASDTPAPTPTAAGEQTIDTDKITPKGARTFLENAQSEMPAGEEYNAITELLDTGSDEDIVSKATSMGYGQKEAPTQQQQAEQPAEQPTAQPVEQPVEQPTTQPVEQQAEQPVGTSAPTEDWATAQINEAINMIPTQARAKLMNKDGSVNWDKVNSDKNVQKALNNPKGVETAIKAINGDEKARNTMKNWGAKKKAAIIHAAQQQMAGQGVTQQPVQQEAIKPVEQPAPKPEVKPAPQGDEQNAQAQNQNNGDQNQGGNPQPQQSQTPETDNQGQGQNGQTEQVKPSSAPVQQFKDILGDYVVDEYGFNNDNTRSYVHKADNGKDVQRVATIQRTKDGKYSASKNSSDKVAEPKIFDTLEEAEAFIAGKKTKKQTTKDQATPLEPKPPTVAEDDVDIDEVKKRIADRVERYGAENAPMVAIAAEKQEAEDADKKLNKLRNKPRGSILSTLVNGSSMHKFKDALLQRYYHGWTPADVTIKGLEAVLNGDAVKGLPEAAQKLAKKYITGMIDRVKEYDKAHPEHAQKIADYQKEQGGLRTDENGIVLLSTTMNAEEAKAQREANDKVLLAKGEEIKQAYIRDTMTAEEARAAITALTSKYNKIKNMPPVSKDALKKLANIRSWILSDNKERSKGVKLTDKERADSMLADAQEEIDKAFKVYGGVGAADKEAISAYESLKKNIQTAKVVFYSNLESEGLKPLKKYEKVFEDAFDKVNGMIEKAELKQFYEEYNTTFKQRIENAFKEAESWKRTPEELREAIKGIYDDFSEKFKKFRKYADNELFPLAAPYALGRSKDRTEERVKEYEKQYNEAHQQGEQQQEQQEQAQQQSNRVDEFRVLKRMATSAPFSATLKAQAVYEARELKKYVKELIEFADEEDYKYGESWGEFLQDFDDYLKAPQEFLEEKLKEKGLPHVAEYDAIIEQYAKAIEQIKNNAADQLKGMFPNVTPIEVNTVEQQQAPTAEPDADGFVDAGAYVNSQLGENFMEDLFSGIDATREQNDGGKRGTKNTTKGTKPPADQAIEADIQEQQVADQVATNEVVFPEIEAAIDSIPGRERATITKYFDQHPEARYVISERLKKGVELFKVPYKDKSGKDNSVYYAKEAGSDEYVKVSKAEAIVMSKVGELEIKETTKDAMNKEKKAKYVTEISEDEDWEYADALEEGKIEGVKKGDKKAVNIIMDFLTIEFADGKGCPFDKTVKTWAEWVRKVALFDAERKNEGLSLDALWSEDNPAKLNVGQKDYLNDFYEYLYKKYENKVEDKSRQKKNLEADMVEQTSTVESSNVESEPVPDQAFIDQLDDIFSNSGLKFKVTDKEPLDSYNPNLLGQVINLGQMAINNYKAKTSEAWHKFMNNAIQSAKKMSAGLKNFATRLLDSVWEYLSNLPSTVSFDAKNLQKTVQNIVNSMGIAKQAYDGGYNYREVSNQLKNSQPKRWEALKDYLAAAFRAIDFYPRKVVESNYGNNGGDGNVDVRAPEQSTQGNSGRGNGNGLETNSGNNGRGNQMGGGQTAQGETNQEFNQRPVQEESGTPISGSGSAASRKQGYQQSGTQKPNDSASMSGNSNGGRGSGTGQNRSTRNSGGLEQNLSQAQRNAKKQADAAAGKGLSELKFNKEPFKAADEQGIAKAVPTLLPEQLKDVVAIEKRLFKKNGKGMLVANGTGTGKTMTGLGEIVRFLQKGARKILIVVPSSNIRDNWVDDGAKVGLPSSAFATITTGKVAPDAINIITYKAFSENQSILKESWDLVVMDECQWVSSGAKSDENERTNTAQTLRAISGHERTGFEDYMQSKYRKEYRELKKLGDKLKKSKKALTNLVAQFGAFGQPVNQLKANIKSMEDKQKALRRKLDIAEQKERKEYDKRLLARKEDTRVLLLSATPFAYSNSIYYAEGLLFNYDKGGYEDYMVDQFGYERKQDGTVRIQRVMGTSIPMPNHILEAKWHDTLVDSGAMINRRLEIQQDYNRRFVKVDGGIGAEIDKGFEILKDYRKGDLNQILAERFEYSKRCRLLEAIKADAAIPMIKEYLKQGKKVVIFHDYKSKDPVGHPFKLDKEELTKLSQDARDEYERLKKEHPELFLLEVNAFHNVDQTLEQEFKDKMAAINGDISFDKRTQIVKAFNNDNSGLDIVSVVAEAGKEGISLHDTTGNHPRVLINLGMPTRPTSSIQIEGRIYRLGQKSNAQIRYLYTDTKIEQKAFVDYISARTRTAETLALGDASRNLDGAFAIGYLASKTEKGDFNAANDTIDTGGKLYDTMSKEELETAMKQMYEQLNADGAVDEDMKAKLAERIQELEDERNAKKREEILTEQNEKKLLATIKEAVAGNKVTKVADGVFVVEFVGGARNLWIDLNNSQAAILGKMTEEQKRSMLSAADIKGSEYEIGGYYTKEANSNIGAVVDIIRLTEVATTHTLDHEIMHFVHNALLKTLEKQHLEKYFKMLLKKQIGEDAYNKLTEEERLARCEEMEADAYAAFCAEDRKPKNMVERIFWKMQKWLAQFAEKFGIETPMGIYIRVRSGEMYGRGSSIATQDGLVNHKKALPSMYEAVNKYKENLVALHNLTAKNLSKILFGENKGKLISPSLAVMPDTFSYNSYGEITLVGDKNMINPETGAARVYTGDAWTPTVPQPKIVDGKQVFYNKATNKNVPYTKENIEKYMLDEVRQQLKADASKIENEQMLAAVLVERLNTIDDMHKAVQRLSNKGDYSPDNLQQTLKLVKGSAAGNQFLQAIVNVLQSKKPKSVDFKGELRKQGVKLSSGNMWLLNAAEQLLDQARNIQFDYLEAKVQRTVDISEFRAAVVPQSMMQSKEVQELERRGVEVFSYKDGSVKQRKEAVDLALEITGERHPVRYQAAGVKAKTANLDRLSIAESMEKRGMTRERIFDETGWWRAEDGKWRFEIKDDIGKIKTGELLFGEDDRMPLGELYDNEDLYRAYPQLKNVVVQLKSLDDNVGGYASKAKNIIAINSSDAEDFESDVSDWKNGITRALKINAKGIRGNIDAYLEGKTISREIDKAIRQSGSSFSEYTFATALRRVNNIVKKLPEYTFDDEVTNEDYIFNGIRFYYTRFNSLEEEMRLTLVHEIQHFVQGFEQHGRGSGVEHARTTAQVREIARILKTSKFPSVTKAAILYVRGTHLRLEKVEFEALQSEFDDIIANMSKEEFQEANRIIEAIGNASDAVFKRESIDYYYDFAGEREARQASSMARTNYIKDLYHALDFRRYPWQHLDELRTGKVQVDFGELLKVEDTIYGEEQLDGTIKFSVKPVDKIDGKGVPDNLDNVVDNKESLEDVKPHGSVQEALQDAQKLGEKNEAEGGIVVKEPKVDKSRDIGLLDNYLHSPSHLAKKNPIFKAFYDIFKKAQSVQEKLRNRWLGQLDGAYKMLKSKEDADAYHNLMVDGELKAKEYSMQELADMGIKDNVAKAYLHTRQMIRNIWEKVNDAHRGLIYRTEKLSAKKVEELSKKPFIENIMVRVVKIGVDNTDAYQPLPEVKLNDKATYEVKYGQPHVFKDTKTLTQEQLDELKASPYAHVVKEEEYKEVEGLKLFKAEVEQVAPPIGKIAGYLPHIFEQWLILVETEQGSVPVSSGKNVKEAVKIAESLQKDAPNVQFYIVPKMFNPSNVLGEDVAEGSVGGASIVLSAEDFSKLEKSISNTFKMSLAEAREALKPVAKKEGKSRFLGSLLHRKGRVGYNTDIADSLSRYIYMTSRYVALQPAKVKAFSLFERTFHGTLGEDYSRTDQLAHVTKNYILHCNGTPNHLETLLTGWLNMIPFWRNYVSTNFGDRSLMSITGRVNGLLSMSLLGGYNISSAVVGLSQLANVYAQIGSRFLGEGMYAYKRMNLRDKRILAETGILYDIGLDTASGFTKRRKLLGGEGDSGLAKAYKFVSYYGDKGMYFFKKADEATRGIAALGAYYKGIEDGMSHKQAIAYAKKVNRDSNFDYGAADAPAIYQRLSGTGIGDLMLLFQKYPIKQFEFMQQMLPYFGSAKKAEKIRFWGAYFLMAGLAGIPLGDWLDELLAKILGYKPTTAVKSYLFTEFGDNIGTRTLAYGVLSNLGVDISRRIGMANLAPQGDSVWETALGPGLNILYRMAQSGSDDWAKTIKAFNPSLGNMAEGIRGYKTNSKNQINYIYGDMEKFFKAAGFRTTGESIASDLQSAVYLDKQQKKDARQKLMMQMVKKRIDGEALTPEDYKTLREQGITGAQFQKAVKAAKMTALQRTRAGMTKQQKKDFAGTLVMEEDE